MNDEVMPIGITTTVALRKLRTVMAMLDKFPDEGDCWCTATVDHMSWELSSVEEQILKLSALLMVEEE